MIQFFIHRSYRLVVISLALGVGGLWYVWYATDQIGSMSALLYGSGVILLNVVLASVSFDRHPYLAKLFIWFSYTILLLLAYNLFMISRGIR